MKVNRASSPIHIKSKNNKKCPTCNQPMEWIEGLLRDGATDYTKGRYACNGCKTSHRQQDSRGIIRGRKLSKHYKNDPNFKCEDIGHLSIPEQLGILREIQSNNK